MTEHLLTPRDVAAILGITPQTLAVWRFEKRYHVPYIKDGRLVRYKESDVEQFIENQRRDAFR